MLSVRSSEQEQLDNLELSGEKLDSTLDGLATINKYLGNTKTTFKAVKREILKADHALRIVDLGCGGGDNLRAIGNWCHAHGLKVDLIGIDGNANALAYAERQNDSHLKVNYLHADILDATFELPQCDLLISSHFIYHFSDQEIVAFLKQAKPKVAVKLIFSELQRSPFAYVLFKLGGVFLPFSKMVKQDGLAAIRRAFTKQELNAIFEQAGFSNFQINWKWAFRMLIEIPVKA